MRNIFRTVLSTLALLFLGLTIADAQSVGDYQSAASGSWNATSTWQTWDGGAWIGASTTPDSTQAVAVTILNGHNVTVAASVGIGSLTISSGGTLTLTCAAGTTLGVATTAVVTVNGILTISGTVTASAAPYNIVFSTDGGSNTGRLVVANGGVVNLNAGGTATSTKGFIPAATWQSGSTLNVNAVGGTAATGWGAGGSQNFYDINYSYPTQTSSFGWGFGVGRTMHSLTVSSTNTGRLQLFGGSSGSLTMSGDLNVSGSSNFTLQGTSAGSTFDTLIVQGNTSVNTTGNFSISRGSQGGTGTSIMNLEGNVSIVAGAMSNSTTTPNGAKFRFTKNGSQNFLIAGATVSSTAIPVEVTTGSTIVLTAPDSVTTLYLNGGMISSSSTNPLVIRSGGTISSTAPGSSSSFVNGALKMHTSAVTTLQSLTFPVGVGSTYRPVVVGVTQSAATVTPFTSQVFSGSVPSNTLAATNSTVSSVGYYKVSGNNVSSATVQLAYVTTDDVSDAANLRIAQGPAAGGGDWIDIGGTGSATPEGTITSNAISDLTTNTAFVLANNIGGTNALPVELTAFTAATHGTGTLLKWITASEVRNSGFGIERKKNGNGTWTAIGFVTGAGTSNSPKEYTFADRGLTAGVYGYRLKQIDTDGKFKYSSVVEATVALTAADFTLNQNYPNPFNPTTNIRFALKATQHASLKVYNLVGQEVATLFEGTIVGGEMHVLPFDASRLTSGTYIYQLKSAERTEVKRMTLIK